MNLSDPKDIKEVIDGCIKGNRKYQEILHKSFYSKMLVACLRYASHRAEAEDLLHDGFIKVYQKLSHYNYQGSFEGWIRRIIVNNSIDYLRKKKEFTIDFDGENEYLLNKYDDHEDVHEEIRLTNYKAQQIIEAIQQLTPAYKAVFNMYVLEDLSHKEIAEELGISIGTSKSNLSKAKVKIKEILERMGTMSDL
ncbi:MAG: sigma-70 family RNA polymerase sigma factor [Bacteroidales bacterium]|nr:sigma-70 family RNA polymerase sigma factor [Bacteroidales bacterium]